MPSETIVSAFDSNADCEASVRQEAAGTDSWGSNLNRDLISRRIVARRPNALDYGVDRWEAPAAGAECYGSQGSVIDRKADYEALAYHFPSRRRAVSRLGNVARIVGQSAKRCFDMIIAAVLLAGLSSLMLALAWLVRRDGKPAFYRHKRVGAGGRAFHCIKFRSMVVDADRVLADLLMRDPSAAAEWEATQKLRHDPRVTPIGRFLRKTSLDELPQLLNVLRGEMSLVGPRPVVTSEARFYGEYITDYYAMRPGITGLWQVSGRSDTTYERRVQLDVAYVRNWSFWGDVIILLKTIPVVLLRGGAV